MHASRSSRRPTSSTRRSSASHGCTASARAARDGNARHGAGAMSDRVVALLDELTDEQRAAFADALPAGWRATWNGDGLDEAAAFVVRDSDVGTSALDRAPRLRRVVRIDP